MPGASTLFGFGAHQIFFGEAAVCVSHDTRLIFGLAVTTPMPRTPRDCYLVS
jgi:hypothetical protein